MQGIKFCNLLQRITFLNCTGQHNQKIKFNSRYREAISRLLYQRLGILIAVSTAKLSFRNINSLRYIAAIKMPVVLDEFHVFGTKYSNKNYVISLSFWGGFLLNNTVFFLKI